ncbi:MAG: Uma2 family endonuclease [Blastocatellia bacterium]
MIHDLVIILGEESNLAVEPFGATTFKRELKSRGVEPDDCFYIQNAPHITGKTTIDLAADPPPDLVVEIGTTNQSLFKLAIYAVLVVPAVWRF